MLSKATICIILMLLAIGHGRVVFSTARAVPKMLNYQGYLTDTLGSPIDDSLDMTFKIYDEIIFGNELWSETQTNVPVERGVFSVLLGSGTPIPDSVFTDGTRRWLELTLEGPQTLSPRTRITAMGYAYTSTYSDTAKYAKSAAADSDWVRGTPDSVLFTANYLGIARGGAGNMLLGDSAHTHTNLGIACTTGGAGLNRIDCTVAGGRGNVASNYYTTVSGGRENTASGIAATVGGGYDNSANSSGATVAGGLENVASGYTAAVGGGYADTVAGDFSFAAGQTVKVSPEADYTFAFGRNFTTLTPNAVIFHNSVEPIRVGIGTPAPDTTLHVVGNIKMVDGNEGTGMVLTSDANGVGSWQNAGSWTVTDSVLYTNNYWGIARGGAGNTLYGDSVHTHVNLGVACVTGSLGLSYKYCTVGGGINNTANGNWVTVAGGHENVASIQHAYVGGGWRNTASGTESTVGGGEGNIASHSFATVGGGEYNSAIAGAATVGGGAANSASAWCATVGGGNYNKARGQYSVVSGGGGYWQADSNSAIGDYSAIGGGRGNIASGKWATVGGGYNNSASDSGATVGGGRQNNCDSAYATVAGGYQNDASDWYATVGGGESNLAYGSWATVPGGRYNQAWGDYGFAAGYGSYVLAIHSNSAAFNDQSTTASGQTRVAILSKTSGTFTIDHPTEPMDRILNHYFVESPEMVLIYRGVAIIGSDGRAEVRLPDYFDALNKNPMVQLTGVGTSDVFVAEKVDGNHFVIGGKPGTEVYWTVTGERKDQSAEITRIIMPVEQLKEGDLTGHSLDDDFLAATMSQLERMGQAGKFRFRTAEGQEKYERSLRVLEKTRPTERD